MEDWGRAGAAVRAARARRWRTRHAFAKATGLSERTLGRLERGEGVRQPEVLAVVEARLGWQPGTIRGMARGGQPAPQADELLARLLEVWPDLPAEARATLVWVAEQVHTNNNR